MAADRVEMYVIRATSRQTGDRMTVSGRHDYDTAQKLLADWKARRRGKRNLPLLRLRVEPAEREGLLFTAPPLNGGHKTINA